MATEMIQQYPVLWPAKETINGPTMIAQIAPVLPSKSAVSQSYTQSTSISPPSFMQMKGLEGYVLSKTLLGKGVYGTVIQGLRLANLAPVAVKVMDKTRMSEEGLKRAISEITTLRSVCHKNILPFIDYRETKDCMFLITEMAEEGDLYEMIISKKTLSEKEAKVIFKQLANAVKSLHDAGFIHRDIKPENVLLHRSQVILADFGFSRPYAKENGATIREWVGTFEYCCPELMSGTPYVGPEVDCWSLGVTLYAMLTGRLPFKSSNKREALRKAQESDYKIPSDMSLSAQHFIKQMMQPNPQQRANIEQILADPWLNE